MNLGSRSSSPVPLLPVSPVAVLVPVLSVFVPAPPPLPFPSSLLPSSLLPSSFREIYQPAQHGFWGGRSGAIYTQKRAVDILCNLSGLDAYSLLRYARSDRRHSGFAFLRH